MKHGRRNGSLKEREAARQGSPHLAGRQVTHGDGVAGAREQQAAARLVFQLPLRGVDGKAAVSFPADARRAWAWRGSGRVGSGGAGWDGGVAVDCAPSPSSHARAVPQGPSKGMFELRSAAEAALMSSAMGSGESMS